MQARQWMLVWAAIWIQAFTGTNLVFSSYSSTLKSVLGISQVQLNFLAVASDLGKAFGWCSAVSLLYFPLWVVLIIAASLGLFGYGLQWLLINHTITLPYVTVCFLCLMAGCSICWFNTVCYVLCIKNFPTSRALALSLTVSFNGVSAALYTLIANAIDPKDDTLYLFLNAFIPLLVSGIALLLILQQPLNASQQLSVDAPSRDSTIFLILNILAAITGLYLLLLNSVSPLASRARIFLAGAALLLVLPVYLPAILHAEGWSRHFNTFQFDQPSFNLGDADGLELSEELMGDGNVNTSLNSKSNCAMEKEVCFSCFGSVTERDRYSVVGEEHSARMLVRRLDFWLYYIAYFCGGTLGLVYSNNLGQIAQSLGYSSNLNSLVTLYSLCSFFGRLLSAAPDFLPDIFYFARSGWLAIAIVPTPMAFLSLVASDSGAALQTATALIGVSSGFVVSAAVSITSELFGPKSAGINHNILITNIPIGSLFYGLLAAKIYDSSAGGTSLVENILGEAKVCMGRHCYLKTFISWGCISLLGLASSYILFLRTRTAYNRLERNRNRTQFS